MKNYYFTEYELHSGDTELNLHLTALGFEPLIDDWCGSPNHERYVCIFENTDNLQLAVGLWEYTESKKKAEDRRR